MKSKSGKVAEQSNNCNHWNSFLVLSNIILAVLSTHFQVHPVHADTAVELQLEINPKTYEIDQALQGTGSIINPSGQLGLASVRIELLKEQILVASKDVGPLLLAPGQNPTPPGGLLSALSGTEFIANNPHLIGTWTLKISQLDGTSVRPGAPSAQDTFIVELPKARTITVDGAQSLGPMKSMNGFLYFPSSPNVDPVLLKSLKPKFWRTDKWNSSGLKAVHDFFKEANPNLKVTLIVGPRTDRDYRDEKPWLNWTDWENYVKTLVQAAKLANFNVDYWDIWSEPSFFFVGTREQFFEVVKHTILAAREVDPNAKFVGPSTAAFDQGLGTTPGAAFSELLKYLAANNLHLDAISWHEFGMPEQTKINVENWRNTLSQYRDTSVCQPQCPEIHVNEFNVDVVHLNPGWTLGYLSYLHSTQIDWLSRSCWWEDNGPGTPQWLGCGEGLDGLFLRDGQIPQHTFWVHKFYADMETGSAEQLFAETSSPHSIVMATKDDQPHEMRILTGRYSCGQNNEWCTKNNARLCGDAQGGYCYTVGEKGPAIQSTIIIKNYPYETASRSVDASIQLIPNISIPGSLPQPVSLPSLTIPLAADGSLTIPLKGFEDGDVYSIVLKPAVPTPTPTPSPTPEPTMPPLPTPSPSPIPPQAAWNVRADDGVRVSGVRVCWNQPKGVVSKLSSIKRFQLYRSTVPGRTGKTISKIANKKKATTCSADTKAKAGVTYYYTVAALDKRQRKIATSSQDSGWKKCQAREKSAACELRRSKR